MSQSQPPDTDTSAHSDESTSYTTHIDHAKGPVHTGSGDIYVCADKGPERGESGALPDSSQIRAHCAALANKSKYRRWADEFYIQEEGKILPMFASPYEDSTGQQREDLLQTIRAHDRLLILGEPGMGKTVALQRMMWETAQADDTVVPIFVPLLFFRGDLLECIRVALSETGELHLDDSKLLRAFLRETPCLIMLDGLNELPGRQRKQAAAVIADFLREFPKHRYVITSRSQDNLWKKLRTGGAIEDAVVIQRITDEQARSYLIAHLGSQKGCELHDRLNECLRGLSRTPLLLWLIKEAGLAGEELPGNRGELFDRFVGRVLRRDEEKLEIQVSSTVKKRALAHLAFTLQKAHRLACEREQAKKIMAEVENEYNASDILNETLVHGLLQGEQQVRFLHQSVQEYFVGLALCEVARVERDTPAWRRVGRQLLHRSLAAWARDTRWAESFVQMTGLTDDPDWLASKLTSVKPWLAFWCSIEGKSLDKQTRATVEAKTIALLHSKNVEERVQAVRELARLENPRIVDYLVSTLDDEDNNVVDIAVQALGRLGEPAVEPLQTAVHLGGQARQMAFRALSQIWKLPDLARLGDSAPKARETAIGALSSLGDVRAVEPLIAVLKDGDEFVRTAAAEALGKLGDARAVEPLVAALKDGDEFVRTAAAEALGELGDVRAVEPLVAALKDEEVNVRKAAVRALGRIWELTDIVELGNRDSKVKMAAAEALGELGDVRAVEPLITALKDEKVNVRKAAVRALGRIWELSDIVGLGNNDSKVRMAAAEVLGKLGDVRAVEPLVTALKDEARYVQAAAAEALGKLGDVQAVGPLVAALKDEDMNVREAAVRALGELGDAGTKSLITALKDGDGNVRKTAAEVLGKLGDVRAVEPLVTALKDEAWWYVREAAAEALGKLGDVRAVEPLVAALKDGFVRTTAAEALGELGDAGTKFLIAALKDGDGNVRETAAEALGKLGDVRAVEPLVVVLKDGDENVRKAAAEALGELGDVRAVEPLVAALKDEEVNVWEAAVRALGRIWKLTDIVELGNSDSKVKMAAAEALGERGDVRAVEPLVAALKDEARYVRTTAAEALGKLGDIRAVEPLFAALKNEDMNVREAAVRALRELGDAGTKALIAALKDEEVNVREAAVRALGRIWKLTDIVELGNSDSKVKMAAAEALGKRGDVRAVEPLVAALKDEEWFVQKAAIEALRELGDAGTKPLIAALKDRDGSVRKAAAEALGELGDVRAVEPLVAALKDEARYVRAAAAEALKAITSQDLGEDVMRWQQWWDKQPQVSE
jgi:HEAT repeat protein